MDGGRRKDNSEWHLSSSVKSRRNSIEEVKGSKPVSTRPHCSISSLTASMDGGRRMNDSLGGARRTYGASGIAPRPIDYPAIHGRPQNAYSSSTPAHGIRFGKTKLPDMAANSRGTMSKVGDINVQSFDRPDNYSHGISKSSRMDMMDRSYKKGVSVDVGAFSTRISSSRLNVAEAQTTRRNPFVTSDIQSQQDAANRKSSQPVRVLPDAMANPVTECKDPRSNLRKVANNKPDRAVAYGASQRRGKPAAGEMACLRNESRDTGLSLAAECMELSMKRPPSADEIKRNIKDGDMEIIAGSVAEAVRAIVRSADMPSIMQIRAFRCARRSCDSHDIKQLAFTLKKEFDKNYGPVWHCIVGTNFGSFITHSAGGFLYFSIEKLSILLFKTNVESLETN